MRLPATLRRQHKYNARKTTVAGLEFDSQKEAQRYLILKSLEQAGKISDLEIQPEFVLQPGFHHPDHGTVRAVKYRADFKYRLGARTVVEDVKGMKTKEYQLKRKLFLRQYPELEFREV